MKKNEIMYTAELMNAIISYLDEDGWNYDVDHDKGVIKFQLSLKNKIKKITMLIRVKLDCFVVYAISPVGADSNDKAAMATMAEFVCRVNYGILNGNFELDFRDGEIRFKAFCDCEDILPSKAMIKNSIYCTAQTFDRYAPGILDIICCGADPEATVDKCEKASLDEIRKLLATSNGEGLEGLLVDLIDSLGPDDLADDELLDDINVSLFGEDDDEEEEGGEN